MDEIQKLKTKLSICEARESTAKRKIMELLEKITQLKSINDKHWKEYRSEIAILDEDLYKITETLNSAPFPFASLDGVDQY